MMYRVSRCNGYYQSGELNLFHSYIETKRKGYRSKYDSKILCLDQFDYFSPFYILFKKVNIGWHPIMVQRYVSRKSCQFFSLNFPIETLGVNQSNLIQANQVKEFLLKGNEEILYPSSFTVDPSLDYSSKEKELFLELTAAFHYLESIHCKTNSFLTSAVKRFKTYRILEKVGHQFLGFDEVEKKNFLGEKVVVMGTHKLHRFCYESFKKHEGLFPDLEKIAA